MKNALLLVPDFMGYDKCIEKALEKKFFVKKVNNELFLPEIQAEFDGISFFRRQIRKLKRSARKDMIQIAEDYTEKYLELVFDDEIEYDLVICVNGHYLSNGFYEELRKRNGSAQFILFLWDDISNILRRDHLSYFDRVYSYNILDCRKFNLRYLPMFVQNTDVGEVPEYKNRKYDIAIIFTAHGERSEFAKRLYEKYKDTFSFFIYLYHPDTKVDFFGYDKPLKYEEYMDILKDSRAVIDYPGGSQNGPTTRFFDAMLTGTKVITINEHIKEYPFYDDNICVVKKDNPVIERKFVQSEYRRVRVEYYNSDEWLDNMIGNNNDLKNIN